MFTGCGPMKWPKGEEAKVLEQKNEKLTRAS